jgi:hypothetical protein
LHAIGIGLFAVFFVGFGMPLFLGVFFFFTVFVTALGEVDFFDFGLLLLLDFLGMTRFPLYVEVPKSSL